MANEQNLKPRALTSEEAKKLGSKGGKASVKARRERKALREELIALLNATDEDGQTFQEKITIALMTKAMSGDTKAFEIVRDTIGEKPTDNLLLETVTPIFKGEDKLED